MPIAPSAPPQQPASLRRPPQLAQGRPPSASFALPPTRYSGWSERKGLVVERPAPGVTRISGWDALDNHQVNFLAAGFTSAAGAAVAMHVF